MTTQSWIANTPWQVNRQDSLFNRLVSILILSTLIASWLVERHILPTSLEAAQPVQKFIEIVLDEIEAPIEPPEIKVKPEPVKPPEQKKPKIEKVIPEKVIVATKEQTVKQAQEKAKMSGILAFADDLADMRDMVNKDKLNDSATIQRGSGVAAVLDRSLITSRQSQRQSNVNIAALSNNTGGVALSARETTRVEAEVFDQTVENTGAVRLVRPETQSIRSIEEVRKVFDANKGAIYAIYNRALRQNPGLVGKIVLELVIEPDGRVSECTVTASEMDDETMVQKLVRRVSLFNFGERDAVVTRISYPVHFLPS